MRNAQILIKTLQTLALAGGNRTEAESRAPTPAVASMLKSIGTGSINGDLHTGYRELLQLSQRRSLIGKIDSITGFRRLPFETPTLEQDSPASVIFVAEGQPIPATMSLTLSARELSRRKLSGLVPVTKELATAMPAESALSRELTRSVAQGESAAFFSDNAATDAAPPGILNGVTAGVGSTSPADDIAQLVDAFTGNLDEAVILTSPRNGVKLASVFDGAGGRGGEIAGIGHATSSAIPDDKIGIVEPGRILLSDDGLEIDLSMEATIYTQSGEEFIPHSLWQNNLMAWRITRHLNWHAATGSVAYLDACDW
ncbi:phage major capsid protein [Vreelandella alkaliphila]|uniref:phage major capsid protein n=1 Tax=Vreelandella alkaliphila TaxID=272774 RepID=UPI003FD739A3